MKSSSTLDGGTWSISSNGSSVGGINPLSQGTIKPKTNYNRAESKTKMRAMVQHTPTLDAVLENDIYEDDEIFEMNSDDEVVTNNNKGGKNNNLNLDQNTIPTIITSSSASEIGVIPPHHFNLFDACIKSQFLVQKMRFW